MPSGASALRGVVLLGCLVTVPSAAVLGTSLPRAVRSVLEGDFEIPTIAQAGVDDPADASEFEPMPLGEASFPAAGALAPAASPVAEPPSGPRSPATVAAAIASRSQPRGGATAPASSGLEPRGDERTASVIAADGATGARWEGPARPGDFGDFRDVGAVASDAITPRAPAAPRDSRPDPTGGEATIGDGPPPHLAPLSGDPFARIQQRLRSLGAVYYLLETWGDQHQLFRFYCRVAVGGNPAYTRHFEAIDADPLRAMSEVVRQVEQWRRGMLP